MIIGLKLIFIICSPKGKTTMKLYYALATSLLMTTPVYADYVAPNIQHEAFGSQKVVYQLNTGDEQEQLQVLRNANNHVQIIGKEHIDLHLVVFASGISVLQSNDEKITQAIDKLRQQGVKIAVCNNTLKAKNIDWHTLYQVKESDIVPAGVAELAYLQQKGFAYIRP